MFCPLVRKGTLPLTRCHEYAIAVVEMTYNGEQVNVTSFKALTVLVILASTPVK